MDRKPPLPQATGLDASPRKPLPAWAPNGPSASLAPSSSSGPPPGRSSAIPTPGNSSSINTGTTIITFLMVFLSQNTQNRDARAINLKLNELIHAIDAARDQMIDIESLSDLELREIQTGYEKIKAATKPRAVE